MPKLKEFAIAANSKSDFINCIGLFEHKADEVCEKSHHAIDVLKKHYSWNLINNVIGMK